MQVNALLGSLKHKIEEIKKDKDWKEKNRKKLAEQKRLEEQRK